MGNLIHAKKVGDEVKFRIWDTSSDRYITREMTEKEVRSWTRAEAIEQALFMYDLRIDERLKRAIDSGTSSEIEGPRSLRRWDKRPRPEVP